MEGEASNMLEDRAAIQRDPTRLEEQANRNFIKLNQDKCNILHLGGTGISSSQAEDWLAAEEVCWRWHGCLGVQRINTNSSKASLCANRGKASMSRGMSNPAQSALIRLHLNAASCYGFPNTRNVVQTLGCPLTEDNHYGGGLEHLTWEERPGTLASSAWETQQQGPVVERMASDSPWRCTAEEQQTVHKQEWP